MSHPLLVVCGPPACGKSRHAHVLARELGAAVLDSDTVTEEVVRAGLTAVGLSPDDRDSPVYKATFREAVYETLYRVAAENLVHVPVVIAGPFTRETQDADWLQGLEERFRTEVTVHFVWCDPEERRRRMSARGEPRDLAKLARWDDYLATCAQERPLFPHRFVGGDEGAASGPR